MKNNKKTTGLLLSILGVISLILITAGVTYAFFTYTKEGETPNSISTGTIVFQYNELTNENKGIEITNALPMSDETGKALTEEGNVFNFNIKSTVKGNANIPYEITARKMEGSTLDESAIKIYLEPVSTDHDTQQTEENKTLSTGNKVTTFAALSNTEKVTTSDQNKIVEKTLFTGVAPANKEDYTRNFILRMWINGEALENGAAPVDYSPYEFVLKSEVNDSTAALKADELIKKGTLITSATYYALPETEEVQNGATHNRTQYERIAYVNMTDRTIYTVSQATKEGSTISKEGFTESEQFYAINGQTFIVRINVYANATVVEDGSGI